MTNTLIDFPELMSALEELAEEVGDAYRANLLANDRYTTEFALFNSVQTRVEVNGTEYSVVMSLNDYWKYIENGTRPHFPPPSAIMRWIEIKPIIPRPFADGKIPSKKDLAYLIGRKISRVGTKGTHDLKNAKESIIPKYLERIAIALGRDVSRYIAEVMPTIAGQGESS